MKKVVWLTGLSGAGKTTIAIALCEQLKLLGISASLLDGDELRIGLNRDLGFSRKDRAENVRRVAEVAKIVSASGVLPIVALVSPFEADRLDAAKSIGTENFVGVWVCTPLSICIDRDVKGLYQKAAKGDLQDLTGVGQEYETPGSLFTSIDGSKDLAKNVSEILNLLGL